MIMDRKTDLITAIVTSINAVLRNRKVMLVWAAFILAGILLSVVTIRFDGAAPSTSARE